MHRPCLNSLSLFFDLFKLYFSSLFFTLYLQQSSFHSVRLCCQPLPKSLLSGGIGQQLEMVWYCHALLSLHFAVLEQDKTWEEQFTKSSFEDSNLLIRNRKTNPEDTLDVHAQMCQPHWGKGKTQSGTRLTETTWKIRIMMAAQKIFIPPIILERETTKWELIKKSFPLK